MSDKVRKRINRILEIVYSDHPDRFSCRIRKTMVDDQGSVSVRKEFHIPKDMLQLTVDHEIDARLDKLLYVGDGYRLEISYGTLSDLKRFLHTMYQTNTG